MTIDFATTAVCRPDILDRTYASFSKNLLGVKMKENRLFINIDPIPDPAQSEATLAVAKKYFREVIANIPETPSFPKSLIWCWRRVESEFFFHLEDDWVMTDKFHIDDLLTWLDTRSFANLRAYLFQRGEDKICLSPCLGRSSVANHIAEMMRPDVNPEQQLRPVTTKNPYGGLHHGYRAAFVPKEPIVMDIGRAWMNGGKWDKDTPETFTTWVKHW